MNILSVHNSYQQPGGEDQVFALEADLLRANGHRVSLYKTHNDEVSGKNPVSLFFDTIWNRDAYRKIRDLIQRDQPEIVHAHNTFPLISPAVYEAAEKENVPVVQTLHNYRLLCPAATFFRNGRVCEDCLNTTVPWPGVLRACYRDSVPASCATAAMLTVHRTLGTWKHKVAAYIALSDFARSKFIEGGLPAEKVFVKPNFLDPDPGMSKHDGGYALFVGRLTPEKGVNTLLDAWAHVGETLPLEVIGDGAMAPLVAEAARQRPGIRWRGWLPRDQVIERMGLAAMLVVPSTWYEGFPMTVVEAFAMGLPVVASKLGTMASLIDHGRTGLHFAPGNASELAAQIQYLKCNPAKRVYMGRQARVEYETKYTSSENYQQLMAIYNRVRRSEPQPCEDIAYARCER